MRNQRVVPQTLAKSLSPNQGGSDSRDLEMTGRLQILEQVRTPNKSNGKSNPAEKGNPYYVGITSQESGRVVGEKDDKENKNEQNL